ncbi:MAG: hypothetical protein DDT24_00361 [Chloroflexi bacterium]|nr:hypothetical protein [Chloroflexota bacterium]MBT9166128.1 hypothetical protein [Chloroflexota bacterium]
MDVFIIIAYLLMFAGLVGTLLPLIPGTPLILVGAIVYGIATDFAVIDGWVIALLALICVGAELLEYVAGAIGAKKYGASKAGVYGAIIGGLVGIFTLGPIGILIGPIVGAVAGELLAGAGGAKAVRAGFGAIIGAVGAVVLKFIAGLVMIVIVLIQIW